MARCHQPFVGIATYKQHAEYFSPKAEDSGKPIADFGMLKYGKEGGYAKLAQADIGCIADCHAFVFRILGPAATQDLFTPESWFVGLYHFPHSGTLFGRCSSRRCQAVRKALYFDFQSDLTEPTVTCIFVLRDAKRSCPLIWSLQHLVL